MKLAARASRFAGPSPNKPAAGVGLEGEDADIFEAMGKAWGAKDVGEAITIANGTASVGRTSESGISITRSTCRCRPWC